MLALPSEVLPWAFQVRDRVMSPTLTAPMVVRLPVPDKVPAVIAALPSTVRFPLPVRVPDVCV